LTGIGVLLVLTQLPTVTGFQPTGGNRVAQTLDLLANLSQFNLLSLVVAVATLVLAIELPRTRLGSLGILVAIVVPSLLLALFDIDGVQRVRDVGEIQGRLIPFALPSFSGLTLDVVSGALAVAAIILTQGAGV